MSSSPSSGVFGPGTGSARSGLLDSGVGDSSLLGSEDGELGREVADALDELGVDEVDGVGLVKEDEDLLETLGTFSYGSSGNVQKCGTYLEGDSTTCFWGGGLPLCLPSRWPIFTSCGSTVSR